MKTKLILILALMTFVSQAQINYCTRSDRSDSHVLQTGDTLVPDRYFLFLDTEESVHVQLTRYGVVILNRDVKGMTQNSIIMSSGEYVLRVGSITKTFTVSAPTDVEIYDMWIKDGQFFLFTDDGIYSTPMTER